MRNYIRYSDGNWKDYPIRLYGPKRSSCCGRETMIVQSMTDGFVSINCQACMRRDSYLSAVQFRELKAPVHCPKCGERMIPGQKLDWPSNYAFGCSSCLICIWLADLLPHYEKVPSARTSVNLRVAESLMA